MANINQRGFTHWRSNRGLAAQVSRISGRQMIHKLDTKLDQNKKALTKSIDTHNTTKVKKKFKKYLNNFSKEEKWTLLILLDELKLINEVEVKEGECIQVDKLFEKDPNMKDQSLKNHIGLNSFRKHVVNVTGPLRQILHSLIKGEYASVKTLLAQHGELMQHSMEGVKTLGIKFKISKQKRDTKKEKKISDLVDLAHELKLPHKDNFKNKIKQMLKIEKKVINSLDDDLDIAFKVILKEIVFYMHLLQHFVHLQEVYHELSAKTGKNAGFSSEYLKDVINPFIKKYTAHFKHTFAELNAMIIELERTAEKYAA